MRQILAFIVGSSIGKKVIMSLTGLGTLAFLITHLGGNLFIYGGRDAFDAYAHHLHAFPLLPVFQKGLHAIVTLHILFGGIITIHNMKSRQTRYAVKKSAGGSNIASSTMIFSGSAILIFMVLHIVTVKANAAHLGAYDRVLHILSQPWGAAVYMLGIWALGLHLFHGAASTLQSLGLNNTKYQNCIKYTGRFAALALTAAFSSIPVYIWIHLSKGPVR